MRRRKEAAPRNVMKNRGKDRRDPGAFPGKRHPRRDRGGQGSRDPERSGEESRQRRITPLASAVPEADAAEETEALPHPRHTTNALRLTGIFTAAMPETVR